MPKVQRRVRFYEVRGENGERLQEVRDLEQHFYDVVSTLPKSAREHWQSASGLRVRGRVYRPDLGATARVPLVIIDRVHREPQFGYVTGGSYRDHAFDDADTEFAEPKFVAFFERNIAATFTAGVRISVVEAALTTWRVAQGLQPVTLQPITDTDRLAKLLEVRGVGRLAVSMPADVARSVYRNRRSSMADFFRSRGAREGQISVTLNVDVADLTGTDELLDELQFLVQDDETYAAVAGAERAEITATYYGEQGGRRSEDFLGQELAHSVSVPIDEPEAGPQPHVASEALHRAYEKKRDVLHRVLGQG